MKRVKIADLKNNLSRHLSYVRDGGDLVVLDRDTPIARLVPFGPLEAAGTSGAAADANKTDDYWTDARLTEMERRGVLRRATPPASAAWARKLRPVKLPPGAPSVVDLLLAMRRKSTR